MEVYDNDSGCLNGNMNDVLNRWQDGYEALYSLKSDECNFDENV